VDLLANLSIPGIASPQLTLIEPDLNAGCAQCIANPFRRLGILRGIAQEYGASRCARLSWRLPLHPRSLDLVGHGENALTSQPQATQRCDRALLRRLAAALGVRRGKAALSSG